MMNPTRNSIFSYVVLCLAAASLFLCVGCKKDDDGGDDRLVYLRFRLGDEAKDYSALVSANDPPRTETVNFVTISGQESPDAHSPSIGFQLVSDANIGVGKYSSAESNLHGTYAVQVVENGEWLETISYSSETFELDIKEIDSWGVKGTFSGVLRLVGGNELIHITEGEFAAPYNTHR